MHQRFPPNHGYKLRCTKIKFRPYKIVIPTKYPTWILISSNFSGKHLRERERQACTPFSSERKQIFFQCPDDDVAVTDWIMILKIIGPNELLIE